jgi:hypothetical protein
VAPPLLPRDVNLQTWSGPLCGCSTGFRLVDRSESISMDLNPSAFDQRVIKVRSASLMDYGAGPINRGGDTGISSVRPVLRLRLSSSRSPIFAVEAVRASTCAVAIPDLHL